MRCCGAARPPSRRAAGERQLAPAVSGRPPVTVALTCNQLEGSPWRRERRGIQQVGSGAKQNRVGSEAGESTRAEQQRQNWVGSK